MKLRFRKPKYRCSFCGREAKFYNERTTLGYAAFMCVECFSFFGLKDNAILVEEFKQDR